MKTRSRLLAAVLMLVMIVGMLPESTFAANGRTLTIFSNEKKEGEVSLNGTYYTERETRYNVTAGESVTVYAKLTVGHSTGYEFGGWYDKTGMKSKNPTYTFDMPDEDYRLEARFVNRQGNYVLSVSSENTAYGTVSGTVIKLGKTTNFTGDHSQADLYWTSKFSVTVTMVDTDRTFLGWVDENGNTVSTAKTYSSDIRKDTYLKATFDEPTYYAKAVTGDNGAVALQKGQNPGEPSAYADNMTITDLNSGEYVTFYAAADDGFVFSGWYGNPEMTGTAVSTDAEYAVQVTDNITLYAKFEPERFSLAVYTADADGGLIYAMTDPVEEDEPADSDYVDAKTWTTEFPSGTIVKVWAKAKPGYQFKEWRVHKIDSAIGTTVSTTSIYSFSLTDDIALFAYFEVAPATYYAKAVAGDNGAVALQKGQNPGEPSAYAVNMTITDLNSGEYVTFYAAVDDDFVFSGWYGNPEMTGTAVSTDAEYAVQVTDNITLYAKFEPEKSSLAVYTADADGGLIYALTDPVEEDEPADGDYVEEKTWPTEFPSGTIVKVWAKAKTGYQFKEWRLGSATGAVVSTDSTYSFTLNENTALYAVFEAEGTNTPDTPVEYFTISYNLNGGKLNGKTGTVTMSLEKGTIIILPAPTRDGHTFDYWEGSRYNAGDEYTVNGDHTFTAQWKKNSEDGNGETEDGNGETEGGNGETEDGNGETNGGNGETNGGNGETNGGNGKTEGGKQLPDTGDNNSQKPLFILMAASLLGMAIILPVIRREKSRRRDR